MPVEATATFRHKASTFSDTLDHQPDRSFGEGFSRIHELTGHRSGTDILQSLRATPRIDGKMSTSEALNQHRASTALATPITGNQVSAMLYMLVNRDRERGRETAIQAHIYIERERERRERTLAIHFQRKEIRGSLPHWLHCGVYIEGCAQWRVVFPMPRCGSSRVCSFGFRLGPFAW